MYVRYIYGCNQKFKQTTNNLYDATSLTFTTTYCTAPPPIW